MTSEEITKLIETEIDGDWSRSNLHGVFLKKCLVYPVKKVYEDSFKEGSTIDLWLVLEEVPENTNLGYKIVFDEESKYFGLAVAGLHKDIFIGFYGTFLDTLQGM
jgi:hypothetical protein